MTEPAAIIAVTPSLRIPASELDFTFSRSGGKGGQNVNKVETRVELWFDVQNSPTLTEWQRTRLLEKLAGRIDGDGVLRLASSEGRTQLSNRRIAVERFVELLKDALHVEKKRRPTRATKGSKERRLAGKKVQSKKKSNRNWTEE